MAEFKTPLKVKLLISVISLFLFLVLLEFTLRTVGYFYFYRSREPDEARSAEQAVSGRVILCVGDSFTWGGAGMRDEAYPAHLQRLLKARFPAKNYFAVNKGECEHTSTQILELLPDLIGIYHPKSLVLLVGGANRFIAWDNYLAKDRGVLWRLKRWVYNLRVGNMVRIIAVNLKGKTISNRKNIFAALMGNDVRTFKDLARWDRTVQHVEKMGRVNSPSMEDPLSAMWHQYNAGHPEKALELGRGIARAGSPTAPRALCTMAYMHNKTGERKQAEKLYIQALNDYPNDESVLSWVTYFYAEKASDSADETRYDKTVEFYLKAMELDPTDRNIYYNMVRAFELQTSYDADAVVRALERMSRSNPLIEANRMFRNYLELFRNKQDWETQVRRWLRHDLEEVVRLCEEHGIKLILQNYPVAKPIANEILRMISQKHSIPLVDNLAVFDELAARGEKDKYIDDDQHSTSAGHKVMAENILNVLVSEGLISQ